MNLLELVVGLAIASAPIFNSAVAQTLRKTVEYGKPDAKWQSWAALYGDNVTLPTGLFAAYIVLHDDLPGIRWFAVSMAITIGIAVVARKMDRDGFTKSGDRDRLYSPTKLWHDFVTWPWVGTLIFWLIGAAVLTNSLAGYIALAGVLAWVAFVGRDIIVGLAPALMHPRVQDTAFARIGWLVRLAQRQ